MGCALENTVGKLGADERFAACQAGVIMAATDKFVVKVRGAGGHGGQPERVKDAIIAASMIVVALQPLISREWSPTDSAILGITRFNTGMSESILLFPYQMADVSDTSMPARHCRKNRPQALAMQAMSSSCSSSVLHYLLDADAKCTLVGMLHQCCGRSGSLL